MVLKRKLECFDYTNVPRAPRSCRRKVLNKRTDEMRAINLLASIAGKLLQECEGSSASSNAFEGDKHLKEVKQEQGEDFKPFKPESSDQGNSVSRPTHEQTNEKSVVDSSLKHETKNGNFGVNSNVNMNIGFDQGVATTGVVGGGGGVITDTCNLEGETALGVHVNNTNLGRDDDEKLYSYHKLLSYKSKSYRSPTIRRIRNSSTSKYWKQIRKELRHSRADVGVKAFHHKRKSCYGYNTWQRETVYRKRRSYEKSSVVTCDGRGLSSGSVSKGNAVKLSIKSFRIPELFVEVPKTATVGSLKRTVMEAVGVLLSGGIHVGVLVKGKKVRDDKKTLSQSGISRQENLSNLGFTLEPCPTKVPVLLSSEDPVVPTQPTNDRSERSMASPPQADDTITSVNIVDNKLELVPYKSDITVEDPLSDSRALVPLPALEVNALAIVPLSTKPKRTELAQRRTRRPFSVTEVEALVQAVEEVGTGRWRDVKLRAFENADHRTYVDLKDKWKTLVHTASITPQQRRGEPVPQELLDRVLKAYGYWSQAKGATKDHLDVDRVRDHESTVSM